MSKEYPIGPAESVKQNSHHLRGSIIEELTLERPDFSKETVQILKFHGTYQQSDRDQRRAGLPPEFGSMVRLSIPGGALTAEQYLQLDRLADEAGDGGLRITSRQDIQFHRVGKTELRPLIRTLNANLLTTLAACGDVVRNVVCCPAPFGDKERTRVQQLAGDLGRGLKPSTRAYYEIWLDGEKAAAAEPVTPDEEPLYGPTYLPRKFKVAFVIPPVNDLDVFTNDIGLIAIVENDALAGYNRAIAADNTLVIAHLHKGGLLNRLRRYDEALNCYEQALLGQELAWLTWRLERV